MAYFWLGLLVLFLVLEAISVQLVSIWFAAGAAVSLIASAAGASQAVQWVLFALVSGICLLAARPSLKRYSKNTKVQPTNSDRVIGAEAVVVQTIDNDDATGQVKALGSVWTARSADGSTISEGKKVKVEGIEGVKLLVSLETPK